MRLTLPASPKGSQGVGDTDKLGYGDTACAHPSFAGSRWWRPNHGLHQPWAVRFNSYVSGRVVAGRIEGCKSTSWQWCSRGVKANSSYGRNERGRQSVVFLELN